LASQCHPDGNRGLYRFRIKSGMTKRNMIKKFFSSRRNIFIFLVILVGVILSGWRVVKGKPQQPQYQTAQAEKGTLINSISGSGSITSGNNTSISTKVSGVVGKVYVTNGDKVTKGQKIADITLDDYAQERQTAAWVAYLQATENSKQAIADKATADIQMWKDRQAILDAQKAFDDMNSNDTNPATHAVYTDTERMVITKTLDQTRKLFSVSESKYLNADADIANANAKVSAALRDYQENSSSIIAPSSGTISDLALAPGMILSANSATSNTSGATIVSAQTVGKISNPSGQLMATVLLTEIDIVNVKASQKTTITMDAYPDKSFTGKILAVNTSGSVSSGVTNYPVTILFDPTTVNIYPNMAVDAKIITNIKNDVILVPSVAVQTTGGQSTVRVLKDGKISTVTVEAGSSNDTQTEIVSGINEGDTVITNVITQTAPSSSSSSVFGGGFGGNRSFREGGVVRINGR